MIYSEKDKKQIFSNQAMLTTSYAQLKRLIEDAIAEKRLDDEWHSGKNFSVDALINWNIRKGELTVSDDADPEGWDNVFIKDLGLSARSYNCLRKAAHYRIHGNYNDDDTITIGDVLRSVPSLVKLRSCGAVSAREILDKFKEIGVNVSAWESEYRRKY